MLAFDFVETVPAPTRQEKIKLEKTTLESQEAFSGPVATPLLRLAVVTPRVLSLDEPGSKRLIAGLHGNYAGVLIEGLLGLAYGVLTMAHMILWHMAYYQYLK